MNTWTIILASFIFQTNNVFYAFIKIRKELSAT